MRADAADFIPSAGRAPQAQGSITPYRISISAEQQQHRIVPVFPAPYEPAPPIYHIPIPTMHPIIYHQPTPANNTSFILTRTDHAYNKLAQLLFEHRMESSFINNTTRGDEAAQDFDAFFGHSMSNLYAWQDLAWTCGMATQDVPDTIRECKAYLKTVYVNIFDLLEARSFDVQVSRIFDSPANLERYSREMGLICPASAWRGNMLFRFMLKKWL